MTSTHYPTPADESQSAETIANSLDHLIEILVRLPLKSLVRSKSVSKGWNSVISDPNFCRRLVPNISGLIIKKLIIRDISTDYPEYQLIPLTGLTDKASLNFSLPTGFRILQSCNGLLLCHDNGDSNYYIYNPTTKQKDFLPPRLVKRKSGTKQKVSLPPPNLDTRNSETYLNLAFDPTKSLHYKVVCVRDSIKCTKKQIIEIYSSETRFWRFSGNAFTAHWNTSMFKEGVFCNGAIHWINHGDHSIVYFNMDDEKFGQLPLPKLPPNIPSGIGSNYMTYLMECRGHLHHIGTRLPPTELKVQEMESDHSGWIVKYYVDLSPLTVAFPETQQKYLSLLFLVREANEEDSYMVVHIPGKVIRLNLKDGYFNKICDLEPVVNDPEGTVLSLYTSLRFFTPYQFIQTLSSV
ncbi:hypothetical protein COLO4_37363 [Corchorus olitorius]|uniref:F-box domain-containing protein n=1 Tax=Corchorus olitorius TaxID=93759 RepID=A0A1R3G2F7_9ROSI|nr:hypothetical protein COLO4_37363 [Corchorus olitorius]